MQMSCLIHKKVSLFDIIGNENTVSCLSINNIHFGDANGNTKLEFSSDRKFLKIYTEDQYVCVAKMDVQDIQKIDFAINQENYTLESYI